MYIRDMASFSVKEHHFLSHLKQFSFFKKAYSAIKAPLLPVEKFSIDHTMFCSSGTLVPPEVTRYVFSLQNSLN